MKALLFVLVVATCSAHPDIEQEKWKVEVLPPATGRQSDSTGESWLQQNSLSEALAALFPRRDEPSPRCRTSSTEMYTHGVCEPLGSCALRGQSYGSCGMGLGSCCVYSKKCNDTTDEYVSHFMNPSFTTVDYGYGECKLTVKARHSNICQYRIDFEEFNLLQPDSDSRCTRDFAGISGGSDVPKLCGDLSGQHMYVNVKPGYNIFLTIDTSTNHAMARKWNIKITQIACNSPNKAPAGCLQFHNMTSGTIRSFNFKSSSDSDSYENRQIQNTKYGICINTKVDYCSVTWRQSNRAEGTFSLTGDARASKVSVRDNAECANGDHITVPGGRLEDGDQIINAEKFCGQRFPEVKTNSMPFIIHVENNGNEDNDFGNTGFELDYRLNLCNAKK